MSYYIEGRRKDIFYIRLYAVRHMVKDHSDSGKEKTPLLPQVLLFPFSSKGSHIQNNTYHGLSYISHGAVAGTRNSSMGSRLRIDLTTHRTVSECSYHGAILNSVLKISSLSLQKNPKKPNNNKEPQKHQQQN